MPHRFAKPSTAASRGIIVRRFGPAISALVLWAATAAAQPSPSGAAAPAAPAPAPPLPAAAPPSAAAPNAPSAAQIAPHVWDVDRVRCSDLLRAADDDRAAAAMFYYGYLAAKTGIHVIDTGRISDNVAKVIKECTAVPTLTVPQAFRRALGRPPARG